MMASGTGVPYSGLDVPRLTRRVSSQERDEGSAHSPPRSPVAPAAVFGKSWRPSD